MFAGCKQDLNVTVPQYVDTPVIYGLLSTHDYGSNGNTHYIRIQKGYLIKGNAYLATGITDSIYYPDNLTVKLYSSNGYTVYTLNRIDGATVGLNKDTGIFANTPNYLYTFTGFLDSTKSYTLVVTKNGGADTLATATTNIVNSLKIYNPSNLGYSQVALSTVQPATATWSPGQNAGVYDLSVRFYYSEYSKSTHTDLNDTYIDIPVFTTYIPVSAPGSQQSNLTYSVPSTIIFNYLAGHLANDNTIYRQFSKMEFNFAAGGTNLTSYYNSIQSQSGLASSTALPVYTNVSGGVGLLSSREFQSVDNLYLSDAGKDSLACDPSVSFLNFLNSTGNTCH